MSRLIFAAAFILLSLTAYSQPIVLKGTVLSDKEPIPYVNIGIKKKGIGTAATIDGTFTLSLQNSSLSDTLTFSAVGFNDLSVPVKTIVDGGLSEFTLTEKTNSLREVVVSSKAPKIKKFGTTSQNPFLHGNAQSRDSKDISELAKFINLSNKPSDILSATMYLRSNKIDSASMRINFYENSNGLPGKRIIEKSIIKRLPMDKGWVTINLEEYNIAVEEDFFIGFEYLPDPSYNEKSLFTYGAAFGGSLYSRNISLGEWQKFSFGRLAAYVTVRQ